MFSPSISRFEKADFSIGMIGGNDADSSKMTIGSSQMQINPNGYSKFLAGI